MTEQKKQINACRDLWIPAFAMKVNHRLPVVEQLKLKDEKQIERVIEMADIRIEANIPSTGTLWPSASKESVVLKDGFVLGNTILNTILTYRNDTRLI